MFMGRERDNIMNTDNVWIIPDRVLKNTDNIWIIPDRVLKNTAGVYRVRIVMVIVSTMSSEQPVQCTEDNNEHGNEIGDGADGTNTGWLR